MSDSKDDAMDSDDVNFEFVNPTTPAQYFHLLRRQVLRSHRKPLIVASPKILLRHPAATSTLADMAPGTAWKPVLASDDVIGADAMKSVKKVVFTSGKHAYELEKLRADGRLKDSVIVRLEALCPFPAQELSDILKQASTATEFIWAQEEAKNMGAWTFVQPRFENLLGIKLRYAGRPILPLPAPANSNLHKKHCEDILAAVL